MKVNKTHLKHLEELLSETEYTLRYEKGQFQSGYCVLQDMNVILINKFLPLTGRYISLVQVIKTLDIDTSTLSEKSRGFYARYILDQGKQETLL